MTNRAHVIFHIDMNSFYASVEMAYNSKLKGKAVAIAGNPRERRGIVVTSSYEARAHGVRTTMPVWEAKRLCPDLIVIPPNFPLYREMSAKIFKTLAEFTSLIEPVSIDEGYMDVTDHHMHPITLANEVQQTLLKDLDIPCSIGIGPNKFLAKTASDMKKPLGITVLRKRELPQKLWPLPIEEMYGVGEKTAEKMKEVNINTIGELAKADVYTLSQLLGINGERLIQRANGIDPRRVDPDSIHDFKSIGNSTTLRFDTVDEAKIKQVLAGLTERVEERLIRRKLKGKTVQLMIRYKDRQTVTRSRKLPAYIQTKEEMLPIILSLLREHWTKQPVRLLGVTMQDLLDAKDVVEQLDIFTYKERNKQLDFKQTVKDLKEKFGEESFVDLTKEKQSSTNKKLYKTSFQKDFLDDYKEFD
ncbi:MAG TPA: DNA polymerase IV [Pseudogracilibacillus sp.]|nr:DNA polymerase IV [Pseudogracilibacillus sp.]